MRNCILQMEVSGTIDCTSTHIQVYAVVAKEEEGCADKTLQICGADPSNACLYTCSCGEFFCKSVGITVLPTYTESFDLCEVTVTYG